MFGMAEQPSNPPSADRRASTVAPVAKALAPTAELMESLNAKAEAVGGVVVAGKAAEGFAATANRARTISAGLAAVAAGAELSATAREMLRAKGEELRAVRQLL